MSPLSIPQSLGEKPARSARAASSEVRGVVSKVITAKDDGWGAICVKTEDGREVKASGSVAHLRQGDAVMLGGEWSRHPKYGDQFKVTSSRVERPSSAVGIERYLEGIANVGAVTARSIVRAFGDDALRVIEEEPARLAAVEGVGPVRAEAILAAVRNRQASDDLGIMLGAAGVPARFVAAILKRWGGKAPQVVQERPYSLIGEFEGIGFKTADSIARAAGISLTSEERMAAGVLHVLNEAAGGEGHTMLPKHKLLAEAAQLMTLKAATVEPVLETLDRDGLIVVEEGEVFSRRLHTNEVQVAERMLRIKETECRPVFVFRFQCPACSLSFESFWKDADCPECRLPAVESEGNPSPVAPNVQLSPEQEEALQCALGQADSILVINGGPGTGKSSVTKFIVENLMEGGLCVRLAAPTGKAARRLSEATGEPAETIHRLLEYSPVYGGFTRNRENPIEADVVVVDECFDYKQPILTENGWDYIGRIVNQEKRVKVWSRNPKTGNLELKRIKRWIKNKAPHSLLKITASRASSMRDARKIRCTGEHKILTPSGYVRAKDLRVGSEVLVRGPGLSEYQFSLLVGSMLGDGGMGRHKTRNSPQPVFSQGEAQREWLEFKHRAFGSLSSKISKSASGYPGGKPVLRFTLGVTDDARRIAREMPYRGTHPSGRQRWSPTDKFIEWIDEVVLMVWFLDNGSLMRRATKSGETYYATLHSERFDFMDNQRLAQKLQAKWGIACRVRPDARGNYLIKFSNNGTAKLLSIIRPLAPSCMESKVPGCHGSDVEPEVCQTTKATVTCIEPIAPNKGYPNVFDLEVEDFHNYIAGNIVVSNCSMVDVALMRHLLVAVPDAARLILVGDSDQLPSVGPGRVLADVIASGVVRVVRLKTVFRQAAQSRIVVNAHRMNRGEPFVLPEQGEESDFYFTQREGTADAAALVVDLVAERIPAKFGLDPRADVQVLTPMNKGDIGARKLNALLQAALNPDGQPVGNRGFRVGDRIMQLRNNYNLEIFNGDTGRVLEYRESDPKHGGHPVAVVDFGDGRKVEMESGDMGDLVLAYASTIHKSQGSEYPAVVMVAHSSHWIMLQRNLFYTGITRAKKLLCVVGEEKAIRQAAKKAQGTERYSRLATRLREPGYGRPARGRVEADFIRLPRWHCDVCGNDWNGKKNSTECPECGGAEIREVKER